MEGEMTDDGTKEEIGTISLYMKREEHLPAFRLRTLKVLFKHEADANAEAGYFGSALRSETIARLLVSAADD